LRLSCIEKEGFGKRRVSNFCTEKETEDSLAQNGTYLGLLTAHRKKNFAGEGERCRRGKRRCLPAVKRRTSARTRRGGDFSRIRGKTPFRERNVALFTFERKEPRFRKNKTSARGRF